MNLKVKRKIIVVMFILAIIILSANLIFDKFFELESVKESEPEESIEISSLEIQQRFKTALSKLGIEENWIENISSKLSSKDNSKIDSDYTAYSVKIPNDLPIVVVLNEITGLFERNEAEIISKEKKINGESLLKIYSGGILKLSADLRYDNSIERDAGNVGILITDLQNLSEEKVKNIFTIPEPLSSLLVPSEKSTKLVKKAGEHNKSYSVLLNDEITDLEFKLSEDYSHARLMHSIRSILGKFSNAGLYIVDSKSQLYSSKSFSFIEDEFNERGINFIRSDSLCNISSDNSGTAAKQFDKNVSGTKRGEQIVIILTGQQLLMLQDKITAFKKIGYKFVNPAKLIEKDS